MPLQRQQALFFQLGAHHLGGVAIDHHLDARFKQSHLGVVAVERQKALFTGNARDLHDLFNQGVGGGQLELEGLDRHLERAQKLLQAELGQHHEDAAANHDQHRGRIQKTARVAADKNGRHDDHHGADQAYEGSDVQGANSCSWPPR